MNNQFKILMIGSALAFIILSAIQYYLIKNTYKYKITSFEKELRSKVSDFGMEFTLADTIQDYGVQKLSEFVSQYYEGKIQKSDVLDSIRFLQKSDSLNRLLIANFHEKIGDDRLEFGCILTNFILYDTITGQPDTLMSSLPSIESLMYGNLSSMEDAIRVNTGTTTSGTNNVGPRTDSFIVSSENYVSLEKWKEQVFRDMWSLIALAVIILLSVIGLFIYTLRAWLQQKKLNEIKNDFINNITHEFKTPLATLSIASKSLRHDKIKDTRPLFDSTLNSIDRQNIRLQKLLDQVMSKSLGASELQLKKEKLSAQELIDNIIHDFAISQKNKDVSIERDYSLAGQIFADRFHITTAIFNLLDNAVKYSDGDIQIKVSCNRQKDDLWVEVSDNGIGIPKKALDDIFDKFYRVNTGDTHDVKGLGLGLYYTKNIIDAHNGLIEIDSKVGLGTKIKFQLQNVFV